MHHGKIYSRLPTRSNKYVPITPNEPVLENHMKNTPFNSVSSMKENRNGYKPCTYIKSHVKDKDLLHPYEAISPNSSTEIVKKYSAIGGERWC